MERERKTTELLTAGPVDREWDGEYTECSHGESRGWR